MERVNGVGKFSRNHLPVIILEVKEILCIEVEIGKKWRPFW